MDTVLGNYNNWLARATRLDAFELATSFLSILDRYEKHLTSKIYVKRVNSNRQMGMLFQDDEWRRPGARQGKIT